jgi:mRNA-degrading endonuclease toxin of MazEF toxin-antitoxin module
VAEVTTTIRKILVEVPLGREEGMPVACVANLDNIRTIPRHWLDSKIGTLGGWRHRLVKRALGYAFEWPELLDL